MSKEEINNLMEKNVITEDVVISSPPLRSFGRGQKFSRFSNEYVLNESKDVVEIVGRVDLVEKINSAYDSNLNKLLDMYLNGDVTPEVVYLPGSDEAVSIYGGYKSKIDKYQDLAEESARLKDTFKLDSSLSIEDTFKAVKSIKDYNEQKIKAYSEKIKNLKVKNKEVNSDEKKTPESKS